MSQGNVSVADDGTVTPTGLAGAIYTARIAELALVQPPGVIASGPAGVPVKRGLALDANALATAIYPEITAGLSATVPPGTITMYGASSAPAGWLLCDGASVLRASYLTLFGVISTTFGTADGSHFNVPDLRGRVPLGVGTGDASDATAHTLAQKAGTETHTLTTPQIPSHTHGPGVGSAFITKNLLSGTVNSTAAATDWDDTGTTTAAAGGGGAHNNLPPYLGLSFIIKT